MKIVGRRSSLFTRLPCLVAGQLGVAYEREPIHDMTRLDAGAYAGNPALKLPILVDGERVVFGALNICRVIAARAAEGGSSVIWPEMLADDTSRNAHELVWHAMSAQVQLVMGTVIAGLPGYNVFFAKARTGLLGSLAWLEARLPALLEALPPRRTSILEAALFCLIEHLEFRPTVALEGLPRLRDFSRRYGDCEAARCTAYTFDPG